jgi:hypothetical protein
MKAIMQKEPQYITDKKGKKLSVVIPLPAYKKMLEDLEELEDIRLYDAVKSRKEKSIPFSQYLQRRRKKNA